tara:strand:- start:31631 stop:32260 length:630 start_codon:yes stop_codon:yes gene_type:complete
MSEKILIFRPFGPSIVKAKMPTELMDSLNKYIDTTIKDGEKSKELDYGHKLAGNVNQEFRISKEHAKTSGWLNFLGNVAQGYVKQSIGQKITKFNIIETWVVRQFSNEYNPTHWHSGHLSGVGYLKVPSSYGETKQKNKTVNLNGNLQLIHGSQQFLSKSLWNIKPELGDFYMFPNYLMHSVFPFTGTDQERRSISFNAVVDDSVYYET